MFKMRHGHLIAILIMGLLLMTGCQKQTNADNAKTVENNQATATSEQATFPLTLKDSTGVEITFETAPSRVVSLSPSATETIFAIGKGDLLQGRTDYCKYPQEAQAVTSVGSIRKPNIETIVAMKPDVVFVSNMFSAELRAKIESLGIKVFDLSSHDQFEGVYLGIENAGKILGDSSKTEALISSMKKTIEDVQQKVKGASPKSAYYVVGYGESGDYTAGKGTFIDQMITMAGGVNAANDVEGWSYSLEKLIEKNPDYLICRSGGDSKKGIEAANGYNALSAVKEGRLIEINNDLLDIQGPRSAEGVLAIAKILHPEMFK